jgi:type VI secretion system protein ImpA
MQPGKDEVKPDEAPMNAALSEMPLDDLTALQQGTADAMAALNSIDGKLRSEGGPEVAPTFDSLSTQLVKLNRLLRAQVALRQGTADAEAAAETGAAAGRGAVVAVGAIRSREDAIRVLDAVSEFFRRNEPSSPIPLIVERAKRLVSKDFLEVLADIAPEALGSARSAGGLRDGQ